MTFKYLIIFALVVLIFSASFNFVFAGAVQIPTSLNGAQAVGQKFMAGFPAVLKTALLQTWNWLVNLWFTVFVPALKYLWAQAQILLKQPVEASKAAKASTSQTPAKSSSPNAAQNAIWQKFQALFKK